MIVLVSAGIAAVVFWLVPPVRPFIVQVFILVFCAIVIGWQPIMLPGDLTLREAMVEKPGLAVMSLLGLAGLIGISIMQILMIHSMR